MVLMLLTKIISNSTIRRCSSGTNFYNYDAKFAPNIVNFMLLYIPLNKIGVNKVPEKKNKDAGI